MNKKKLVAAVTAFSLAATPIYARANSVRTAADEEVLRLLATQSEVSVGDDMSTTDVPPAEDSGSVPDEQPQPYPDEKESESETEEGPPSDGEASGESQSPSTEETETPDVLSDVVTEDEQQETADDSETAQENAVEEIRGPIAVAASSLSDPDIIYKLIGYVSIVFSAGDYISPKIDTSECTGLTLSGPGTIDLPGHLGLNEVVTRAGATLLTDSLGAAVTLQMQGNSTIKTGTLTAGWMYIQEGSNLVISGGKALVSSVTGGSTVTANGVLSLTRLLIDGQNSTLTAGSLIADDPVTVSDGGLLDADGFEANGTVTVVNAAIKASNARANAEVFVREGAAVTVETFRAYAPVQVSRSTLDVALLAVSDDVTVTDGSTVESDAIDTTGNILITGNSTLNVTGDTYAGNITLNDGIVTSTGSVAALNNITVGNGSLTSSGTVSAQGTIEVQAGGLVRAEGGGAPAITAAADILGAVFEPTGGHIGEGGLGRAVQHPNDNVAVGRAIIVSLADVTDYDIISGDGSTWDPDTGSDLEFITDGPESEVLDVYVNGDQLSEDEFRWVDEGDDGLNIGVEIDEAYLDNLGEGEHEIVVTFANGDAAGASFNVAADDDTTAAGSGTVDPPTQVGASLSSGYGSGTLLPKMGDPALAVGGLVGAGGLLAAIGAALRRIRRDS